MTPKEALEHVRGLVGDHGFNCKKCAEALSVLRVLIEELRAVSDVRGEIERIQAENAREPFGGREFGISQCCEQILRFIEKHDQPPADCPSCRYGYEENGDVE